MKQKLYKNKLLVAGLAFIIFIAAMISYQVIRGNILGGPSTGGKVLLMTSMGNITLELWNDMPITTTNFKSLVNRGVYDGTIFHRVEPPYVIQGGDPTGTGYGDPSLTPINDEYSPNPEHNWNLRGTLGMAKAGNNTATSQFFINLQDNRGWDDLYAVFGRVYSGMAIVDTMANVTRTGTRPNENITIIKAQIIG